MASRLELRKLARAASALNARCRRDLPPLILMTDERRLNAAVPSALALPQGAAIIVRHRDAVARETLAGKLRSIAQARGLKLLIANDPALCRRIAADGLHLSETRAGEAFHWKAIRPDWLITAAAHSARALARAASAGADAALLAPAFPTASHIGRASLGTARLRSIAAGAPIPVYALGGVNASTAMRLEGAALAGLAAIEGLAPDHSA